MDKIEIRKEVLENLLEKSVWLGDSTIASFARIMIDIQPLEDIKEIKNILTNTYDLDDYHVRLFIDFLKLLNKQVDKAYARMILG